MCQWKKLMNDRHWAFSKVLILLKTLSKNFNWIFQPFWLEIALFCSNLLWEGSIAIQKKNQFKLMELKLQKYVLSYISAFITFTLDETKSSHPSRAPWSLQIHVISWQFEANWSFFYNQFHNACQYNLSRTLLTLLTYLSLSASFELFLTLSASFQLFLLLPSCISLLFALAYSCPFLLAFAYSCPLLLAFAYSCPLLLAFSLPLAFLLTPNTYQILLNANKHFMFSGRFNTKHHYDFLRGH